MNLLSCDKSYLCTVNLVIDQIYLSRNFRDHERNPLATSSLHEFQRRLHMNYTAVNRAAGSNCVSQNFSPNSGRSSMGGAVGE